ncbi:response regulator transcription factor [Campylobacter sp.]|uniref:response regulator transcription factor n=1 Tax=Campylobacter sp. TaxID=205 RepID=UPI001B106AFB|nr:response regulator transcription factor [Campylobacter sp.]MBO5064145.1 response regulator transcription factor [Campylobacter sp.]MBQ3166641.1 response regulator transcription factor [Campylobacter sp.]
MSSKILLVEDEPMLCEMVSDYLASNGYEVVGIDSYDEALSLAYEYKFDIFIFDVKIIGGDGFELLSRLRESGVDTPCIFTTSLNDISDLAKGFKSGCDDYIKKPFELAELLLRIDNILKRKFSHLNSDNYIQISNNIKFDIIQKKLIKDNLPVQLAKKESDLLALFLKNRGKILSRDEIYMNLWDYGQMPSELSLRVYIRNLRKIIGEDKIISHPKLGYEYA